jgi:hypothetical protein
MRALVISRERWREFICAFTLLLFGYSKSSLNEHVHFHVCAVDGVFAEVAGEGAMLMPTLKPVIKPAGRV